MAAHSADSYLCVDQGITVTPKQGAVRPSGAISVARHLALAATYRLVSPVSILLGFWEGPQNGRLDPEDRVRLSDEGVSACFLVFMATVSLTVDH